MSWIHEPCAVDRECQDLYKVVIREPFPALNTTDAFIVDYRTACLLYKYLNMPIAKGNGINLVIAKIINP